MMDDLYRISPIGSILRAKPGGVAGQVFIIDRIFGPETETVDGDTLNYIKYNGFSIPTAVPTATPPVDGSISTITSDNIGTGFLGNTRVYVATAVKDVNMTSFVDLPKSLLEGQTILCKRTAQVTATDTGDPVTVYIAWRTL